MTSETQERENQALELRRAGYTFDVIADQLGYKTRNGAHQAYRRALKRAMPGKLGQETIELELDRLDRLHNALWPKALRGDLAAADRVLKISQQRTAMLRDLAPAPAGETAAAEPKPEPSKLDRMLRSVPRPA